MLQKMSCPARKISGFILNDLSLRKFYENISKPLT